MMTDPIARTARYQDDLARLLAALEPVERAEVLDGVREHIDVALVELGGEPTDADVDRILGKLGSPGMVAEAALAERPSGQVYRMPPEWRRTVRGRWVPPVALLGIVIGSVLSSWSALVLLVLACVVLLVASDLWSPREKLLGGLALPVCGWAVLPFLILTEVAGEPFGILILAVPLAAVLVLTVMLWRRGARQAGRYARVELKPSRTEEQP